MLWGEVSGSGQTEEGTCKGREWGSNKGEIDREIKGAGHG